MTDLTTEKLAELVAQRHACLLEMHKLGAKQSALVASGEIGALLRLLSIKNQLIVALQAIERQLAPFHQQEPECRAWTNANAREHCANQIAECQRLLEEIMHMERENERLMTARRDQVASQLQTAQSATTARRAYQVHQGYAPRTVTCDSPATTTPSELRIEA